MRPVSYRKYPFLCLWVVLGTLFLPFKAASEAIDYPGLAAQLQALDNTLVFVNPEQDITLMHPTLVDHILPSLAPTELVNERTVLRLPSDLLGVAQLLFFRRLMYPQTSCFLVLTETSAAVAKKISFLVVSFSEDKQSLTQILDRRVVYPGTRVLLLKMNRHFGPSDSQALTSFESLKKAHQNPGTITAIHQAIQKQKDSNIAEFGGFMTIDYSSDPPLLHLHFVKTQGQDFIRKFKAVSKDWKQIVRLMKENPAEFAIVPFQYRSCLKTISLNISAAKKEQRVFAFVDLFLYLVKNSYCPDVVRYVTLLSDDQVKGAFVGDFHIHPFDNDVSYQDKLNSRDQRVLVIIPRPAGYDLVDLFDVDPQVSPELVIEYRSKSTKTSKIENR
ncbi:hypothetical protein ACFL27_11625 [candidate division CSSED10-310 bacterium]|uniref:Uncharacterized protein n=1 Tax=candidate division CSSED10-310 bacterium TaxID=2855610 RepID=A0ABV6YXA6_UNCC1